MLLYEDIDERNAAEIECIKEALERGQFCVYTSIDMHDKNLLRSFISRVPDCDTHIEQGNLLITDFQPFYSAALVGSLGLFEQLKKKIEENMATRASAGKSTKTLIVADAACHLVRNKHFGEAARLETWWQQTHVNWMDRGLDISIVCSHPAPILKEKAHAKDTMEISHEHSLVLDLKDLDDMPNRLDKKLLSVLVAEPEEDMHEIYQWAFNELPIEAQIVKSGKQCHDLIVSQNKKKFDVVIVDSHLPDADGSHGNDSSGRGADGLGLVRWILDKFPDQGMIITTTNEELVRSNLDVIPLQSSSSNNVLILPKPFEISKLLALLKPAAAR